MTARESFSRYRLGESGPRKGKPDKARLVVYIYVGVYLLPNSRTRGGENYVVLFELMENWVIDVALRAKYFLTV